MMLILAQLTRIADSLSKQTTKKSKEETSK